MVSTGIRQRRCDKCEELYDVETIMYGGIDVVVGSRRCSKCPPDKPAPPTAYVYKREPIAEEILKNQWLEICPPLYRETELSKLKIPIDVIKEVLAWKPSPRGIGLSGKSGTGKSRLMFKLLRRLHFEEVRILAISGKRFESWCHRMFEKEDDARIQIKAAHQVKVLFIDDIGKEKYTERVESEFYDLIEDRISHLLPILWTTNASGTQLETLLGKDRGAPIIRRLREFTEVLTV